MSRKKKPSTRPSRRWLPWNDDDFNLDSHGVEAPPEGRLEVLAELGRTPEEVNEEIRERYVRYLERVRKKKEREEKKARKADE